MDFSLFPFQVIITVPLAVLKSGAISFSPPLSDRKAGAINRLGAGLVEKVATDLFQACIT